MIDLDHAVIVDVEASRAIRQAEVGSARTMLDRTQERFGLWPARLAADSAYGSAENLAWLVHERGIEPHIPVFDKSQRSDGTFSRSDFAYDHARDLYTSRPGRSFTNTAGASVSAARASIPKASCATAPASRTAKPAL